MDQKQWADLLKKGHYLGVLLCSVQNGFEFKLDFSGDEWKGPATINAVPTGDQKTVFVEEHVKKQNSDLKQARMLLTNFAQRSIHPENTEERDSPLELLDGMIEETIDCIDSACQSILAIYSTFENSDEVTQESKSHIKERQEQIQLALKQLETIRKW